MSARRAPWPLTLAGSDPSGGAGLQADLKVFLRFGLSGGAVPTALTEQSAAGVRAVRPVTAAALRRQLAVLLADHRPAAVKLGLVPGAEAARVVAEALGPRVRRGLPVVLDPVLAPSRGVRFVARRELVPWARRLLPLARVVTPNAAEAAELSGLELRAVQRDPRRAIDALLEAGARAVLITGGQGRGPRAVDVLGDARGTLLLPVRRVPRRRSVHGTGCALSAALTACLARGEDLPEAVRRARAWLVRAIRGAHVVGRGARLLDFGAPAG